MNTNTWKAIRRAEHASTNAASEMRRRSQFGFDSRMRDIRDLETITSREDELGAGDSALAAENERLCASVRRAISLVGERS